MRYRRRPLTYPALPHPVPVEPTKAEDAPSRGLDAFSVALGVAMAGTISLAFILPAQVWGALGIWPWQYGSLLAPYAAALSFALGLTTGMFISFQPRAWECGLGFAGTFTGAVAFALGIHALLGVL